MKTYGNQPILTLLHDVITGYVVTPDTLSIAPEVDPAKQKVIGVFDHPLGRRAMSLISSLHEESRTLQSEYDALCSSGERPNADVYEQYVERERKIEARRDALRGLFWSSVYRQFPILIGNKSVSVCRNWEVIIPIDHEVPLQAMFDGNHPALSLADDLVTIISGGQVADLPDPGTNSLRDLQIDPSERVVGQVGDPVMRNLWALSDRLLTPASIGLPEMFVRKPSFAEFNQWAREQKVGDLDAITRRIVSLRRQSQWVLGIFWEMVREMITEVGTSGIAIRADWNIVILPEDDLADIAKMEGIVAGILDASLALAVSGINLRRR